MKTPELSRIAHLISNVSSNRYQVIDSLGAGGMGSVYLVRTNDKFGIERALKVVEKSESSYGEIEALKNLDHPGIPKIIEVLEDERNIYIIQEYVKGKSLRRIIDENGKIPEEIALIWMDDIANTLSYLHSEGLIHRDIKPTNIMITPEGEVKLIDFGLARKISDYDEIDENVIGTRNYTAPERYDKRPADERSDIYGFGSTCYYLTTGEVPLEVTSTSQKPTRMMKKNLDSVRSPGIARVIARCIEINPDKRYQSFNEVRYNLNAAGDFDKEVEKEKKTGNAYHKGLLSLLVAGIVLAVIGALSYFPEREFRFQNLVGSGQESFNSGDLQEAANAYQKALSAKDDLSAYQGLYETFTAAQDYDGVITGLEDLFARKPESKDDPNLLYLLGNAYYEKGEYKKAEPYLSEATEKDPTVDSNLVSALNYIALGDFAKAQEAINNVEKSGGDANMSKYLSAEIDQRQGRRDEAVRKYSEVLSTAKGKDIKQRAAVALSGIYQGEGNYAQEIATLESAKKDSELKDSYYVSEHLGEAYYNQAKNGIPDYYNKAGKEFNDLINAGYNRPYIYRNLAIVYQEEGNFDQAEYTLNNMEELYPEDYTVNVQRAWLALEVEGLKNESERDYSEFATQYEAALNKSQNAYDSEIELLTERYNELVENGWLE